MKPRPSYHGFRALFVLPSLRVGGAERVITTVLNALAGDDIELHLALLRREGPFLDQLSAQVAVHDLAARRALHAAPALRALICRLRPDAVLATAFRLNLLTTLLRPALPRGTRLIVREVTVLESLLGSGWRARLLTPLAQHAFRQADAVICQTNAMRAEFEQRLRLNLRQLVTIFNPVDFEALRAQAEMSVSPFAGHGSGPHVVGVGRLDRAKGFDRLVDAFPALLARRPNSRLWLVGDGPEAASLRALVHERGIAECVQFVGMQPNPYVWMRHADLFVLPSRREGLPNALLEATALRCPTIALEHPGGTREIMERLGQTERVVRDLSRWDDTWFDRPPESVRNRARDLTDVRQVVEQYRKVLLGDAAIPVAA